MSDVPPSMHPERSVERLAAWRSAELEGSDLPQPLTELIGREAEIETVAALLRQSKVRLVTLTGPGGIGKTRLAIHVAQAVTDAFPDGMRFVSLAPIRDPALAVPTLAGSLGVRESADHTALEAIVTLLRDRRFLLILDNFEHVMEAATQVAALLAATPSLTVLVTSRAPLRVSGERVFQVPPLSEPTAARLFIARAEAVKTGFAATDEDEIVVEICRRLDGLPLAIELAAARSNALSPQAILARLEWRLPLLTGGPRDQPERHQTLRNMVAWSYELLPSELQRLFRRLAVFAGGFSLEAAEAVAVGDEGPAIDVLDGIAALVDRSLLHPIDSPAGEPRFGMLFTIREFAAEQLATAGEVDAMRRRHAEHFVALAERAEPEMYGIYELSWLEQLDVDRENFRVALEWAEESGETEIGLRLGGALFWFWLTRQVGEGREWLTRMLDANRGSSSAARAKALVAAGALAWGLDGENDRAERLLQEALDLWRQAGDRRRMAQTLVYLGLVAWQRGDYEEARSIGQEGLSLARDAGDWVMQGGSLLGLGLATWKLGDRATASDLLEEALALYQKAGHRWARAYVFSMLSEIADSQELYGAALAHYAESLQLYYEHDALWIFADVLSAAATTTFRGGQVESAVRFFAAAEVMRESLGATQTLHDQEEYERVLAEARHALGDAQFAQAWRSGREATPEQLVTETRALSEAVATTAASGPARDGAAAPYPAGLSAREVEVLRLVAEGLTNAQIADRLFLSENTIRAHLHRIYQKLDIHSRAEAVRFMLGHDLA
jgi:predicted ATPase/DNA-binding CsgD family transcriptional regulator